LSSGSTFISSSISNGINVGSGASWNKKSGGFTQQLKAGYDDFRTNMMALKGNLIGGFAGEVLNNITGVSDGFTFNILNAKDFGLESNVGLFAVTLGGSKGLSAGISSDGINVSNSMWKDMSEGQKYLNKLNDLRERLQENGAKIKHNDNTGENITEEFLDAKVEYNKAQEEYMQYVYENEFQYAIAYQKMMIKAEKDPAKKEELKKQLEDMMQITTGLSANIFGEAGGLNINYKAGKFSKEGEIINIDGYDAARSVSVGVGGQIDFDLNLSLINTALLGHEWMHDGVSSDKDQATKEEANCFMFQNVILKNLMMKFGTDVLTSNVDMLKDYLAYTLIEQKGGTNNEEAQELLYKYIQQSHDLSSDLWNLITKDGKIIAVAEKGDTFYKLLEKICNSLPAELKEKMQEEMKEHKDLWKNLYVGAKDEDASKIKIGGEYDISNFFSTVLGIQVKDINIDEKTQNINVDNSVLDKVKELINNSAEKGKEIVSEVADQIENITQYLNLSKIAELKKQAKAQLEKAKQDKYIEEQKRLEFNSEIDINKVLGQIAKDLIKVLKDVKQNAKDENGKELQSITSGVMFYENIFVDKDYKDNLENGTGKNKTYFNPMAHNSLAVVVIDGKIAGLGFGSTLPVKASDAYDKSNSAVTANGLYMAKKGTYNGGNCYKLYQTIYATDEQGKTINNNDYVDAWENGGTAKIPILNSSNPRNSGKSSPYAYATGILLHQANHSGKESSTYPSQGCITFSDNGGNGLMNWTQVWNLLEKYQYIFIYVNRNYMSDYSSYGF